MYIWVKYASADDYSDITDNPDGAKYIGIAYRQSKAAESNDPTKYTWSKIQGDDEHNNGYTVILDNEVMNFPIDERGIISTTVSYDCNVIVYNGKDKTTNFDIRYADITIPPGLKLTINNTRKRLTLTSEKGYEIETTHGIIDIPILVDGFTFIKHLVYSFGNSKDNASTYTWIAYSRTPTPKASDMQLTPENALYVGVAVDKDTPDQSYVASDYKWIRLKNTGDSVISIVPIYYRSVYDDVDMIPKPTNESSIVAMQTSTGLNASQGAIALGMPFWDEEKPKFLSGYHLWKAYKIKLSGGGYVFTDPVLSSEWEINDMIIGGAQLIRNSKTLIDERIYWF